jgi:pyridinium-3,5-biscarboxylic acid mononucleotide synthase
MVHRLGACLTGGQGPNQEAGVSGQTYDADGQPREARPDFGRAARKGIPEIVLAGTKTDEQVIAICGAFVERTGRALVSRLRPGTAKRLVDALAPAQVELRAEGRIAAVHAPDYTPTRTGGRVGVLTAGTSDVGVAEEARLVAEEMGCDVATLYDVGVAGLHRLLGPLQDMLDEGVDALVVAAGMDGALPSVVAGLAPVPVIGVPVSVGYGVGGRGRAAMLSMLQTCALGLVVVNVDNGVGAGASAALIANRMAAARNASARSGSQHLEDISGAR